MNFLDTLKSKLSVQGSKDFEQNANRVVPQGTANIPYNSGISEEDAYKLALAEQARKANYDRAAAKTYLDSQAALKSMKDARNLNMESFEAWADETDPRSSNIDHGLAAQWMRSYK